jgi:hypothetical protein
MGKSPLREPFFCLDDFLNLFLPVLFFFYSVHPVGVAILEF